MNYKIIPITTRQELTELAVKWARHDGKSRYEFVALRNGITAVVDEDEIELPCMVVFLPPSSPWGWVVFVAIEQATVGL